MFAASEQLSAPAVKAGKRHYSVTSTSCLGLLGGRDI